VLFRHKDLSTVEKGEKMNLIFALASIILVYPILTVLPLNLTAKQRLIIVSVSFVISLTGVLATNTLAIWQVLLLIVALAFLVSILISKRMPVEEKISVLPQVHKTESINLKETVVEDRTVEPTTINLETEIVENTNDEEEALKEIASILEFNSPNLKSTKDELILEDIDDILSDELQSHLYVAASIESDLDIDDENPAHELTNDIQFNELEDLIELEEVTDRKETKAVGEQIQEADTSSYLSEIEKLLLEEETDSLLVKEEKPLSIAEEKKEATKEFKLERLY
jgi:hypothetical protein